MSQLILSFLGSLCPAIFYNVRRERLIWSGVAGAIGWMVFSYMLAYNGKVILSTFVGAVAVGIYSESMARILKSPATVFSICGIFPLVPGIGAYSTIQMIVENRLTEAAAKAVETLASAGAIAFGIMLVSTAFGFVKKLDKIQNRDKL